MKSFMLNDIQEIEKNGAGLPPGNDKIRGTLSTAENFFQKKLFFNLKKKNFQSAELPRKSGSPAMGINYE